MLQTWFCPRVLSTGLTPRRGLCPQPWQGYACSLLTRRALQARRGQCGEAVTVTEEGRLRVLCGPVCVWFLLVQSFVLCSSGGCGWMWK